MFLGVENFGWVEVSEKKIRSRHRKWVLLHIIVQYPPPSRASPPLLPTILRNIFPPRVPLYCNKILAISCKGQEPRNDLGNTQSAPRGDGDTARDNSPPPIIMLMLHATATATAFPAKHWRIASSQMSTSHSRYSNHHSHRHRAVAVVTAGGGGGGSLHFYNISISHYIIGGDILVHFH